MEMNMSFQLPTGDAANPPFDLTLVVVVVWHPKLGCQERTRVLGIKPGGVLFGWLIGSEPMTIALSEDLYHRLDSVQGMEFDPGVGYWGPFAEVSPPSKPTK